MSASSRPTTPASPTPRRSRLSLRAPRQGGSLQETLALGLLGFALGALLISYTYPYFRRRLVIVPFDQYALLAIVMVICVLASLLGISKALRVDPTTALGGGA
jgi:ABC-type antimicrobial peptide transport system permease subunit